MDYEEYTLTQLSCGFTEQSDGAFCCIECGRLFSPGEVFPMDGRLFTARRAAELHVQADHPDRLHKMLGDGSKYLSLTENQAELIRMFGSGMPDAQIAKALGISVSTVRHHKFTFREKAKAAKLYLAVFELMEQNKNQQAALLAVHRGATMVDDRYVITQEESEKILRGSFESLDPLRLRVFSPKEKKKLVILRKIAEQFTPERHYTEAQVNSILMSIYGDYATLRRYLIEYGFLERTDNGSDYWVK